MNRVVRSLLIGAGAGVVDCVPMLLMGLPWQETLSAFVHWLVLGLIIAHTTLPVAPWLKGMIVAVLSALPIVILVGGQGPQAVVPILVMSVGLGSLVGWLTDRCAAGA